MRKRFMLLAGFACLLFSSSGLAQIPILEHQLPARSLGMAGLGRTFASGGNAMFLNPAALGVSRQYVLGVRYNYSNADPSTHTLGAEWTDSTPNALNLSMALGYDYDITDQEDGNNFHGSVAYSLRTPNVGVHFGVGGHMLSHIGGTQQELTTSDAGVVVDIKNMLLIGVVGYNLLNSEDDLYPRGVGGGFSYWKGPFMMGFEIQSLINDKTTDAQGETSIQYHGGLQYKIMDSAYLRTGVNYNDLTEHTTLAGGLTIVAADALGIEAGYQQNVTQTDDLTVGINLQLYSPFGNAL